MSHTIEAPSKRAKTGYVHDRKSFLAVYEKLRDELLTDPFIVEKPDSAVEWIKEMLDYNVPGGKLNRGMAVYDVLAAIKGDECLSEEDSFKANALGWCIEWLQAFFLVADDIMDASVTRRGQPCWYKQPKVGMIACNDYILLECCIYRILKFHFGLSEHYTQLLELFHEVTYQTSVGQLFDLITAPPLTAVDLSRFTLDAHTRIVTYKTAFYTFYLPVACGMVLAGVTAKEAYSLAQDICIELGRYFQIQDDVLDCFGDPAVTGKVGTDVEDCKCSWLVCTALELATPQQQELIKANYGRKDEEKVAVVKGLYRELGLEQRFAEYESSSYAKLSSTIAEQQLLPASVFTRLLEKIYKRQK